MSFKELKWLSFCCIYINVLDNVIMQYVRKTSLKILLFQNKTKFPLLSNESGIREDNSVFAFYILTHILMTPLSICFLLFLFLLVMLLSLLQKRRKNLSQLLISNSKQASIMLFLFIIPDCHQCFLVNSLKHEHFQYEA